MVTTYNKADRQLICRSLAIWTKTFTHVSSADGKLLSTLATYLQTLAVLSRGHSEELLERVPWPSSRSFQDPALMRTASLSNSVKLLDISVPILLEPLTEIRVLKSKLFGKNTYFPVNVYQNSHSFKEICLKSESGSSFSIVNCKLVLHSSITNKILTRAFVSNVWAASTVLLPL